MGVDVRLAQWCRAHPPASSAAPTSASRWMLRPVKARVLAGGPPEGAPAGGDPAGAGPGAGAPSEDGLVPGADRVAPPAALAVRISGTTQAAAPAVATADIRPMAWRL